MSVFEHPLYQSSPMWLQERVISARARLRRLVREGTRFREALLTVEASQWYDAAELNRLQLRKFRQILEHAYSAVPYYEEKLRKAGIDVREVHTLEDIKQLPLLDKAEVLRNASTLLASGYRGPRIAISTSGSTGTPLKLFQTVDAVTWENAFVWRQVGWAGYARNEPRAWIRGDMVVPFEQRDPPFWRLNTAENMLMLSSYHLGPPTVEDYVRALERFDPALIQAYPSSIGYVARYLKSAGREYRGRRLRAVVTSSETLSDEDRRCVESQMRCKVFDYYGNAERVGLIQSCEHGRYHIASDYALVELLDQGDGLFEIVGTGFYNRLMPLIRYRTGDFVERDSDDKACECGRAFPLVKRVVGRGDDYIKTRDGRHIGRLDHIFKGVKHIAAAQLVQDEINQLTIRLVPFPDFSGDDQARLIEHARQRVGVDMEIRIEVVQEIPRSRNGKFRAVICNVRDPEDVQGQRMRSGGRSAIDVHASR